MEIQSVVEEVKHAGGDGLTFPFMNSFYVLCTKNV